MATAAPIRNCLFCGQRLQFEAEKTRRRPWEPPRFAPTNWVQMPHKCPDGAVEAWVKKISVTAGEAI